MNKNYIIQWKSTVNGRTGRGTRQFEKAEAERLVEELNREFPEIHHEAVVAGTRPANSTEENAGRGETGTVPMLSIL